MVMVPAVNLSMATSKSSQSDYNISLALIPEGNNPAYARTHVLSFSLIGSKTRTSSSVILPKACSPWLMLEETPMVGNEWQNVYGMERENADSIALDDSLAAPSLNRLPILHYHCHYLLARELHNRTMFSQATMFLCHFPLTCCYFPFLFFHRPLCLLAHPPLQ